MSHLYTLNEQGEPVPEEDLMVWEHWYGRSGEQRRVERTELSNGVVVSTVFLGVDMAWQSNRPLLWETMVSDAGCEPQEFQRCGGKRAHARLMHQRVLDHCLHMITLQLDLKS